MKRILAVVAVVVVALAYLAGFWPQHRQLTVARTENLGLQQRLAEAESRVRLAAVLGQLLRLSDAVTTRNYGEAATLSSSFFDSVRAEAARPNPPAVTEALERMLRTRDQVTSAIAQTDPSVSVSLKEHERTLRRALGYPVGATP